MLTPAYALAIKLDDSYPRLVPLRIPRDFDDLLADTKRLTRWFCTPDGPLPADAVVIEGERIGYLENEPGKNPISGAVRLRARQGDTEIETVIFVKFQTGRSMPLGIQALRAALEPGVAREVDFYRHVAPDIPIRVPHPWHVDAVTAVNRVVLAMERIEGWTPSDSTGCPLDGVRSIIQRAAEVNAWYLEHEPGDPRLSWIPAQRGLDCYEFVADQYRGRSERLQKLWQAVRREFDDRPITFIHGDCRPGNMLFPGASGERMRNAVIPDGEMQESAWSGDPLPEVILSDWEGCNVGPLYLDFAYLMVTGVRVADRRKWGDRLLAEYIDGLRAGGTPEEWCDPVQAREAVQLLSLVMLFYSKVFEQNGWWEDRKNPEADWVAWRRRFLALAHDLDAPLIARILNVPEEWIGEMVEDFAEGADPDELGPGPWLPELEASAG